MNPSPDFFFANLFMDFEIDPNLNKCIVIPVKNEEEYIDRCLTSLGKQIDFNGNTLNFREFEILILANNCTDQSVIIINSFQKKHTHIRLFFVELNLAPPQANIGFVRRLLMEAAFKRLRQNEGGVILTTDGDTVVARDWIAHTENEIKNGADAVGGRIFIDPTELDEHTRFIHEQDEKYQLLIANLEAKILQVKYDPFPRHHQHFNGSFAVTTECYEKSGGIPHVAHLEDCAFFDRLQEIDAKVRHSPHVKVYTSGRCVGRTEIGLSYQLNMWKNVEIEINPVLVECGISISERFGRKRKLKEIWEKRKNSALDFEAEFYLILPDFIAEKVDLNVFKDSEYFGAWYAQNFNVIENKFNQNYIPLDQAVEELQKMLSLR